jgi:hypothetical protein
LSTDILGRTQTSAPNGLYPLLRWSIKQRNLSSLKEFT